MGNEDQPGAGQGKLAELIATRGGTASPEAPFVIEQRGPDLHAVRGR